MRKIYLFLLVRQPGLISEILHKMTPNFLRDLRQFVSAEHFRSATVDELLLSDNYFRRPLRPEDFSFLKFDQPIKDASINALTSLTAQRTLLSIHESDHAVLPAAHDAATLHAWRSFYEPTQHNLGKSLLPDLERHAFYFLDDARTQNFPAALASQLADAAQFWSVTLRSIFNSPYASDAVKFILIQSVPLWKSAASAPAFSVLLSEICHGQPFLENSKALEQMALDLGLRTGRHSYWQFYLPSSLGAINLLHRFARSPLSIGEYTGARLMLEADHLNLRKAICPSADSGPKEADQQLFATADHLLRTLQDKLGPLAIDNISQGAAQMAHLLALSRTSLLAQLDWLSDPTWAQLAAAQISNKIRLDAPDIDRDTFVEPREMCSTTHVHDEHRLVVIESGEMVFWGNVGMRHHMGPGEMILVPKGRLHGSTVLSETCTYHQPIIPDDWVQEIPAWRTELNWSGVSNG